MKMLRHKSNSIALLSASVLVLVASLTGAQTKPKPEWKAIGSYPHRSNEVEMFYDAGSITRTAKDRVQVWIKQVEHYDDEKAKQLGLMELVNNRKFLKLSTDGYEKFAYSTSLIEFNCQEETARNICFVDYDEAEKIIGKKCAEETLFAPVMTEATQKLFKLACKQK